MCCVVTSVGVAHIELTPGAIENKMNGSSWEEASPRVRSKVTAVAALLREARGPSASAVVTDEPAKVPRIFIS